MVFFLNFSNSVPNIIISWISFSFHSVGCLSMFNQQLEWVAHFATFADCLGVNFPTVVADFKLPPWCHWTRGWGETYPVGSCELIQASSSTFLNPLYETSNLDKPNWMFSPQLYLNNVMPYYIKVTNWAKLNQKSEGERTFVYIVHAGQHLQGKEQVCISFLFLL